MVVDDTLIEGDCEGNLNAYDVSDPRVDPPLKWTVKLDGLRGGHPGGVEGQDLRRHPRRQALRPRATPPPAPPPAAIAPSTTTTAVKG